jgi:heme-degrading monooxygenase HmoA
MHALFFEVRPHPGHLDHYFAHVARLRPILARHKGLVFLDRYASLSDQDVLLSHQLWESEEAIIAWRSDPEHRRSQTAGNNVHFADYRIRVGARVMYWRAGTPDAIADPEGASAAQHVLALYGTQPVTDAGYTAFESVNSEGRFISLATYEVRETAKSALRSHIGRDGLEEASVYSIRRDYGLFDRAQAPQ